MENIKQLTFDEEQSVQVQILNDELFVYLGNRKEQWLKKYDDELNLIKEFNLTDINNFVINRICGFGCADKQLMLEQNNCIYLFNDNLELIKQVEIEGFSSVYALNSVLDFLVCNSEKEVNGVIEERVLILSQKDFKVSYISPEYLYFRKLLYTSNKLIIIENSGTLSVYEFDTMQKQFQIDVAELGYSEIHESKGEISNILLPFQNSIIFPVSHNHIISVDLKSGKIVWDKVFDETPYCLFIEEETIFYLSNAGIYYHLDALTGNVVFEKDHTLILNTLNLKGLRTKTKPLVLENNMFFCFSESGTVVCADKKTGDIKWHYQCKDDITNIPILLNEKLLVKDVSNNLYLFDSKEFNQE